MKVLLRVRGMEGSLRAEVAPGEALLFGRSPDPSRLPEGLLAAPPRKVTVLSDLVSTNHVLVVANEAGAWVLDLQSRNGTSVRHEGGALHLELGPQANADPQRVTFPLRAVWNTDDDFARGVFQSVAKWLDDADIDADVTLLPRASDAPERGALKLATGEHLVVTPRAGTHALRLADDLATVARFVESQNALRDEERGHEPGFVLRSQSARESHHAVCEAARRGRGLLLLGPSGTGKERFARCYHQHSSRGDGAFVAINCGALPEALIENELFGSVPGAHHGAVDKRGLFEAADGGTLFLDEVADLSLATQVKLLRVLEDGTFRRLGDVRERRVDVHVVCATNRDLRAAIEAGRFREDLWFRLARYEVTLAPLRERLDDIDALLRAQVVSPGRTAWDALSPDARVLVRQHPWPGNVREFLNFVGRLPDAPDAVTDAASCRQLLGGRASETPRVTPTPLAPPTTASDWHHIEARVWKAWRRTHDGPPATFQDLGRFVDDYLKPAFVAWHGNVPTEATTLDELPRNAVAKRLGIDWNTASKWLSRYLDTFVRGGR
ncbi:MAG: sigma 54-interacting transcriptional regulator [Polyangiales bacterium]